MNTVIAVILTINLVLLAVLSRRAVLMRREIAELKARCHELDSAPPVPYSLRQQAQEGTVLISLHILNPMQLAINKVWLAGIAGRITPSTIRRIVAREAVKQIQRELKNYGVVAELKAY